MSERITERQWNRTLLHRQHLLDRADEDAVEVIDRCVGLQSQDPRAAFFALWSRIDGFNPAELDDLLTSAETIRMALLRGTVFLIDGLDARWIRQLAEPALRAQSASAARELAKTVGGGADPDAVVGDAAELLAGGAISGVDLGAELATRYPGADPTVLVRLARAGLPMVQIPPRGLWRGTGAPTYRLLDDWLGPGEPALDPMEARKELIRLYLRGFGPATVDGIATWSGLRGLAPVIAEMVADWDLMELTGPDGEELVDLDGLDVVDGDAPAPVRLIAPYDHVLVSAGDRSRIADDAAYARTRTPNGRSPGFVLVDGHLAGTWRTGTGAQRDQISVSMFDDPSRRIADEVEAEVTRLETWCAAHQ